MDYIYFFYGFSFLLLAVVCRLLVRNGDKAYPWGLLGLFGLLHGLNEWAEMVGPVVQAGAPWAVLRLLLLASSFAALAEAGRSALPGAPKAAALYPALAALAAAGWGCGEAGLNGSIRVALGLPGGLLAAAAALERASGPSARPLRLLGAGLLLYGLAAGTVGPPSDCLLARWLNYDTFFAAAGFPVQLLRGLLAVLVAAAAWSYMMTVKGAGSASGRRRARAGLWAAAALVLMLAGGAELTRRAGLAAGNVLSDHLEGYGRILQNRAADAMARADGAAEAMSGSPRVIEALRSRDPAALAAAESTLDRFKSACRLTVCYLLDLSGRTVASTNRVEPDSFIGKSYAFRQYFRSAAAGGTGSYFALGVTSGKRGYYAAHPVRSGGRLLGVGAVKLDLDFTLTSVLGLEHAFIVSPEGVVFMCNDPELLLKNLWPATRAQEAELERSEQFGRLSFEALLARRPLKGETVRLGGDDHVFNALPLGSGGWSVVTLTSLRPVRLARLRGIAVTMFLLLLTLAFFIILDYSEAARGEAEQIAALRDEVRALEGIIPICSSCKKVRDDGGYWGRVEAYISRRTGASFTHSICPDCAQKLYPEFCDEGEKGAL